MKTRANVERSNKIFFFPFLKAEFIFKIEEQNTKALREEYRGI